MTDTAHVFAVPYVHNSPEKLELIVNACCEHRPWFDDPTWRDPVQRRTATVLYLSDAARSPNRLWEVWAGANLVGLLILNKVTVHTDAHCHFIFFDHKLANKRVLCLNAMQWAFEHLDLHRLSVEIPTYARALANFARKKLGFRYEAEARTPSWPKDAKPLSTLASCLGSRRHQATLYEGQWHDVLLLSITRQEFTDLHARPTIQRTDRPDAAVTSGTTVGTTDDGVHEELPPQSSADDSGANPYL